MKIKRKNKIKDGHDPIRKEVEAEFGKTVAVLKTDKDIWNFCKEMAHMRGQKLKGE